MRERQREKGSERKAAASRWSRRASELLPQKKRTAPTEEAAGEVEPIGWTTNGLGGDVPSLARSGPRDPFQGSRVDASPWLPVTQPAATSSSNGDGRGWIS